MSTLCYESSISHHGIKGQRWGVRRYQDQKGHLTKAGKSHINSMRSKIQSDQDIPKMLSSLKSANRSLDIANKPMKDFLSNKDLSTKYINDYVKKNPTYLDDRDYDVSEWRSAMKNGGYDLPPYKNYAKDNGINWKKQRSDYRNAFEGVVNASTDYTESLVKKYGSESTLNIKSNAIDNAIRLEAEREARKRKVKVT